MNVLVYLVPMALALGLTGLVAFLWSLRAGQYDDNCRSHNSHHQSPSN